MTQPPLPSTRWRPYGAAGGESGAAGGESGAAGVASVASVASKVAKDVSIIAVVVVICIILVVVVSVALLVKFLRGVVDGTGRARPTYECSAWLAARQRGYLAAGPPPETGKPWTPCGAAEQAVDDARRSAVIPGCSYGAFLEAQGCPGAGAEP